MLVKHIIIAYQDKNATNKEEKNIISIEKLENVN